MKKLFGQAIEFVFHYIMTPLVIFLVLFTPALVLYNICDFLVTMMSSY